MGDSMHNVKKIKKTVNEHVNNLIDNCITYFNSIDHSELSYHWTMFGFPFNYKYRMVEMERKYNKGDINE